MKSHSELGRYARTDLACESGVGAESPAAGARYREYLTHGISAAELTVEDRAGEIVTGRRRGRYVTLSFGALSLMGDEDKAALTAAVAEEIISFTESAAGRITSSTSVLVAGLGNRRIAADSLGPAAADGIAVTRHMAKSLRKASAECSILSSVVPGVTGQTGVEAAELILSAASIIKPDVIIAVDSLAARSVSRLCTTIQLSDSGISPGSGIGNRRKAIDRLSMGVPVIAVGMPTVADSSSLVYDALSEAGIDSVDGALSEVLENGRSFFVSPKDSDITVSEAANIISRAVNSVFAAEIS